MSNTPTVLAAVAASGTFLAGVTAAWSALWGPWAKRRAQRRLTEAEDRAYRRATHQALYGIPARHDDSGALIARSKPGLVASMEAMQIDVAVLKSEFPANGVTARAAIDATNQNVADLRHDFSRHLNDLKAHPTARGT